MKFLKSKNNILLCILLIFDFDIIFIHKCVYLTYLTNIQHYFSEKRSLVQKRFIRIRFIFLCRIPLSLGIPI